MKTTRPDFIFGKNDRSGESAYALLFSAKEIVQKAADNRCKDYQQAPEDFVTGRAVASVNLDKCDHVKNHNDASANAVAPEMRHLAKEGFAAASHHQDR